MGYSRIIVAAGGTYGHIHPAIVSAVSLKKISDAEVIFVSPNRELEERLRLKGISLYFIDNCKIITGSLFDFLSSISRLIKALAASFLLLLKLKPSIVVGFGGYAAFPVVLSACLLRIPAVIHEQNVELGKANRILCFFVDKILLGFSETKDIVASKKAVVVGNPLRQELKIIDRQEARRYLGLSESLFTVLVMGGTSGARNINEKFSKAAGEIKNNIFQVIHLTGKGDFEAIKNYYAKAGIKNRVFSFSDEMPYLFSASDLIISRAGASTISEISYFRLPAILVPYPYAGAHQKENAKVLSKGNKAVIIEDMELTVEALLNYLNDFIAHPESLAMMQKAYPPVGPGEISPADALAGEVLKLLRK